jgi:gamma-glutamyltranspeptidase/glutathione hydrolase
MSGHGIVAAGHDAVADAAAAILAIGGNAFDACVAAGFAGAVAEPGFTSLGGGGFLLAHTAEGEDVLFDFFVDTPGRGRGERLSSERPLQPHFLPVTVRFHAAEQVFHAGAGSVAVPGCLAGYLHVHRRLGRLPLEDVVAPAVALAFDGVAVNATQAEVLRLVAPILTREPEAAAIVAPHGRPLHEGERLTNHDLARYLERLAADPDAASFHHGPLAEALVSRLDANDGLLTVEDLASYAVIERAPLELEHRGTRILTNPSPSFGGSLIALALRLDGRIGAPEPWGSPERAVREVAVQIEVDRRRAEGATKGTTHVTVADADGNVASMTTSNGEGSGDVIPGTGVLLNNMLGEDDLHPDGFHAATPGARVASMMAPSLVLDGDGDGDGRVRLALGSGGSKRIRTAIAHVIAGFVDHGEEVGLQAVVDSPRLHWDGEVLQAEPGLGAEVLEALRERWTVNEWPSRNLYFGGVHAVAPGAEGAGDARRSGVVRRWKPW